MREIYMPVFEAAVKEAHVGSVMDSYNPTDGRCRAQNNHLDNEVLKKEWGFDGILISDWFATFHTPDAVNAGLDLEMPVALHMNRENLLPGIQQGKISIAAIDEKCAASCALARVSAGWTTISLISPRSLVTTSRAAMFDTPDCTRKHGAVEK